MQHDETAVSDTAIGPDDGPAKPSELVEVSPAHYEIRDELARGGMGRILVARDRRIGRTVALKELLGTGDALTRRFEREALVTGRLQHPAIVPVYEAGRWPSGEPFYAMKLVAGTSLDKAIAEKTSFAERLALLPNVIQICEAMAYAHGERVIHRDLKPANVLVGKFGETVVVDWGLAKGLDEADLAVPDGPYRTSGDLTAVGSVMGTPMYMPPEQAQGDTVDERADVYALGAMLYHVLTGGPPYRGTSANSILEQVMSGPPPAVAKVVAGVPDELAAIVGKAMARDLSARYPTAKELADELVRFQAGQLVSAHEYSAWDMVRRFVKRHRAAVIATAAIVVLGGAIAMVAVRSVVAARDAANVALAGEHSAHLDSLVEQGRAELIAEQPLRAAAFLAEAYSEGASRDLVRLMLGRAMRPVDALVAAVDTGEDVKSLAIAPSGTRFATESVGHVVLWTIDGARVADLVGARGPLAFEGAHLVAVDADSKLASWDAQTGAKLATLEDSSNIDMLAAGAAGRIYGANFGVLDMWDSATGKRLASANVERSVDTLSVADAGVVVTAPDVLTMFDAATLSEVRHATLSVVANEGDHALARTEAGLARYDLAHPDQAPVNFGYEDEAPTSIAAGTFLGITHTGQTRLMSTTGEVLATFGSADLGVLSPNGTRIALGNGGPWLWIYDEHGTLLERFPTSGTPTIAFTRDGTRLVAASELGLRIWRVPSASEHRLVVRGKLDDGAVAGARTVAMQDNVAIVIDATGTRELHATDELVAAVLSPDGARVATATGMGGVVVWDATSGATIASIDTLAITLHFSPDGKQLVSAGEDAAYVWDSTTGARVATLSDSDAIVTSARFSPDGKRIVTAAEDGIARVYANGALQLSLRSAARLTDAEIDPSGTRIVTASADAVVRIWDATSGAQLHELRHERPVGGATFSHDGKQVVSFDATEVRTWNVATGTLDLTIQSAEDLVDARFAPDDKFLAGASAHHAMIWEPTGEPVLRLPPSELPVETPVAEIGGVVSRSPRRRASYLAFAPDASWVMLGGTRFDLPRETRGADAIRGRVEANCGWRIHDGALVPTHEPTVAAQKVSRRQRTYDFSGDTIEGAVRKPGLDPQDDLVWDGVIAGTPTADIVKAVEAKPHQGTHEELLVELAHAYDEAGELGLGDRVDLELAHSGKPLIAVRAELALARRALAEDHPQDVATHLVAALGSTDDDEDVAEFALETGRELVTTYAQVQDDRYALAARRIYTAYLARPRGHDENARKELGTLKQIVAGELIPNGNIDKATIRRSIVSHHAAMEGCYVRALAHDPTLSGTVTVRFTLEDGVLTASTSDGLPTIGACIVQQVRSLPFPRAPDAGRIDVTYPLIFHRVD